MESKGKAFVTGATGFVGQYLVEELLCRGYEVHGLYRKKADWQRPLKIQQWQKENKLTLHEGDLSDYSVIHSVIKMLKPDVIFHLGSQSFVPHSIENPLETFRVNCGGTQNLLESIRTASDNTKFVFAGSSEEYGLQVASEEHYKSLIERFGHLFPEPKQIPEVPLHEDSPMRPMSPYAASKIYGDTLTRTYFSTYGLHLVVSRAFNHEGAGRGEKFITSSIVKQCSRLVRGEQDHVTLGNVSTFRDWSHVKDMVDGYILLSKKGQDGNVYVMGSQRTNSGLTYLLLTLRQLGLEVYRVASLANPINYVVDPLVMQNEGYFGCKFPIYKVDLKILQDLKKFTVEDKGLILRTTKKPDITLRFDLNRVRAPEVPILLSRTTKIQQLGFKPKRSLVDIINDQIAYYAEDFNRNRYVEEY